MVVLTTATAILSVDWQVPLWRWNMVVAMTAAAMKADKRSSPLSMTVTAPLDMTIRLLLSVPQAVNPIGGFISVGLPLDNSP